MRTLTEPLREAAEYQTLLETLKEPGASALADGCVPSQKLHLTYALSGERELAPYARFRLILTYSDKRVRQIQSEYVFYDRNTVVFPARDLIFYQADLRGKALEKERMLCLRRIMEGRPTTIVTTFAALMTPQVPLRTLQGSVLALEKKQRVGLDQLSAKLLQLGYEKTVQVEEPGQFAVRGDIVDIYDLTEENPCRLEFFDDEIDSIRSFDLETQRSIEQMESVRIYPAAELVMSDARRRDGLARIRAEKEETVQTLRDQGRMEAAHRLSQETEEILERAEEFQDYAGLDGYIHYFYPQTDSFLELLSKDQTMVFLDEPSHIREEADAVELEFRESTISRSEKGYVLPGQMQLVSSVETIEAKMKGYRCLGLTELASGNSLLLPECIVSVHARSVAAYNKSFDSLAEDLRKYRLQKYRCIIISASRTRAKRLAADLTARGLTSFYSENPDRILEPGEIMTYYGSIAHGFEYPQLKFIVIAETDIFGAGIRKKTKKHRYEGESIRDFAQLKVGDYVVHEDHGIGIYRGVEKIEVDGIAKDYIKIEYGGGGTLYILPGELKVLQKYASQEAAKPKLNKLGSQEWAATRNKVKGAVEEVAADLVQLYAKRQSMKGHAFEKDTVWQKEFEEMFPFEETQDQLNAIADTKRDMESDKIMDRLICGDVGFGKTEIAIRAAFKAVQDGRQVAVLVPTTILAQQHFNTFTERMKEYPVCVEMLSRFRTAAEQKKTLSGIASGRVDIVIGTHRLLSKDVTFKSLGLLVVDEEQRFGVAHKEKIKKLRENVDVLTLSATPIPRTLHMSMIGIRDMSVLEEAPQDRVSIQTYVMEYNEEMVREAVLRELSRGGQVYYVYNRVNDIAEVSARLCQLIPEARIGFAHGQMNMQELEKVMYDFISGQIDVLVSTTIIETGLDISNVNTIIIHDSDRMGLSQLYQLRGRVGRSSRTAYAFLMYKRDKLLREEAQKRLAAIREFTDLGSGFRIAMRDLEIRGAGAVLGKAQHGHMAAVGYDLYCKMLDTAVKEAKGLPVQEERNVVVNLSADAFIPGSYILNEAQKLDIYKKIAAVASLEDCEDIRDELRDRFGEKIPAPAENLLRIALIRSVAEKLDIAEIAGGAGTIRFTLTPDAGIQVARIPSFLAGHKGKLTFSPKGAPKGERKGQPFFEYRYPISGVTIRDEAELLSQTEEFLVEFSKFLR